MTILTKWS